MTRFNANEILEIALLIERNGEDFYRRAESKVDDPKLRDLFRFLALEEVGHADTFRKFLDGLGRFDPGPDASEEYYAYLRAYADNLIFSQQRGAELAASAASPEALLRFAMQREQDSILFYLELRGLVPEAERGAIDRILDEERSHYRRLAELAGVRPEAKAGDS